MRYIGLIILVVLCLASYAVAEESAARTAGLTPVLKAGDSLCYNVKVRATGNTVLSGASKPVPIDTVMDLVVSYKVGEIDSDGSTQISIAALDASAVIAGKRMALPASIFPKTIAFIDKNGDITRLFSSDTAELKVPGINSKNLILLFRPNAPAGDVMMGSTWKKLLSLPPESEKYDFSYKFESIESINGKDTARVKADLVVLPPSGTDYSAKGFIVTNYSLDGCSLVKSHAEMTVKINNQDQKSDAPGQMDAVISLDVEPEVTEPPAK